MAKDPNHIHMRLGNLMHRVRLVCVLSGESSMSRYIRSCIERCIDQDMLKYPDTKLTMRPDSVVYRIEKIGDEVIFHAITRTIGGERCWILGAAGRLPLNAGGNSVVLCDLTVAEGQQGCEGRAVAVSVDAILGKTRTARDRLAPPGVTDPADG